MAELKLIPFPFSQAFLDRYRIRARKSRRPGMIGGHLTHRKGQSLEFREYIEYAPGDDIRHVDWRASARYKKQEDWLIRKFVSEERYTLAISIDTRDTMRLPIAFPKLQIAAWLTEAIAKTALNSGDDVILHRLFGRAEGSFVKLRTANRAGEIFPTLKHFAERPPENTVDLKTFSHHLPPAAVWLIITDFYFDLGDETRKLARRIATAQDGWRWILMLDMDSWPYEKAYLGEGDRRIEGPGLESTEKEYQITSDSIKEVENSIEKHKEIFRKLITRVGYDSIRWEWCTPEIVKPGDLHPEKSNLEKFFRDRFAEDTNLLRLFMRQP
jgi:hypothetical protein